MSKANKGLAEIIGIATAGVFLIVALSSMAASFWFMCDDSIAEVFGYPPIGNLDFFSVWAFTVFFRSTIGASGARVSSDK